MFNKETLKSILRISIFGILAFVVFESLSSITVGRKYMNTWVDVTTQNPLYDAPKNTIDVASFGASSGMTSFSPLELWESYGISAYNYSSEQQSPIISYNNLKEVLKRQDVKVVLLNTQMMLSVWYEGLARKAFDRINLSKDKFEGVKDFAEMKQYDSLFSYVFPLYKFHTRWKSLNKYDFMYNIPNVPSGTFSFHNGYIKGYENQSATEGWEGLTDTGITSKQLAADESWYYSNFINLCKEKEIEVILYSQVFDGSPERHNAIQAFANLHGIPFIDFHMQDTIKASGINLSTDIGAHQSTYGAIKGTQYIGNYLHENYSLPDHRGDPDYDWLNDELADYRKSLREYSLLTTQKLSDYLSLLQSELGSGYTVIFSVKDEAVTALGEETLNQLKHFGFETEFSGKTWHSFIGIWQNSHIVYESISESIDKGSDALELKGTLPCRLKFYVNSSGYFCGNTSSIIINGQQLSKNSRGFNVVVYDNITERVVDSVSWDTYADDGTVANR